MWIDFIILGLATWISFVKSSLQAAGYLMLIFLLLSLSKSMPNLWPLVIPSIFLMFTSLLIPKPNPRHQKRRFRITKLIYSMLFLALAYALFQYLDLSNSIHLPKVDPELLTFLGPLSFLIFALSLMMVRKNAS